MISKLLAWFGGSPKKSAAPRKEAGREAQTPSRKSPKPKVAPERIGELGEHKINIQLDQLPKDCRYASDLMIRNPKSRTGYSQIDHVVVSGWGIFVMETKNYSGEIAGAREDRQWTVNRRFRMYNPLKQNYGHIKALEAALSAHGPLSFISIVSFTMRCRFSIDPGLRKIESDELVVYDVELSEFIGRKLLRLKTLHSQPRYSEAQVAAIHRDLLAMNVVDPAARAEHVRRIKK